MRIVARLNSGNYDARRKMGFLTLVNKNAQNGCWEHLGCRNIGGYACASYKNRLKPAHRVSWILHNGAIPRGLWVLHKCDNRICVNPDHLFLGTRQDNVDDMVKKGRHAKHLFACRRLSSEQVKKILEMKRSGMSYAPICKEFRVVRNTIFQIVKRITHKDVSEEWDKQRKDANL